MQAENKTVIVIGGGPAGMLAAAQSAKRGNRTLLLERNNKLGKKLYITGKGRCNVTNACDITEFMDNVPRNNKFLYSAINAFGPKDLCALIEENGVELKTERGKRVFPVSDKASDITKALEAYMSKCGVEVRLNTQVDEILTEGNAVAGVRCGGEIIPCRSVVIATGGLSYPLTGSTGDGLSFAQKLGHKVTETRPALVPLNAEEDWLSQTQGLTLKNVELCAFKKKKELFRQRGELLFTHFGISGPLVLTLSSVITNEDIKELDIFIDLKPALTEEELDSRLIKDFNKFSNKQLKNALVELLPGKLQQIVIQRSNINPDKIVHQITKQDRQMLVKVIKYFKINCTSLRGFNEAVITRGGVNVKEVDPQTMQSKLISGLFFAGEVLDVDAFTGGFNLQIAFSTGYLAGMNT